MSMLTPGIPALMYAVHDVVLDVFGPPHVTEREATMSRDVCLAGMAADRREELFPVVPVAVTIEPAPVRETSPAQFALVFEGARA